MHHISATGFSGPRSGTTGTIAPVLGADPRSTAPGHPSSRPDYLTGALDEIESSDDLFVPRRLGPLLGQFLAEGHPREPIDCGA